MEIAGAGGEDQGVRSDNRQITKTQDESSGDFALFWFELGTGNCRDGLPGGRLVSTRRLSEQVPIQVNDSIEGRHHVLALLQRLECPFDPGFHLPNPEDFEVTPKVTANEPSVSGQLKFQKDLYLPVRNTSPNL